MMLHANAWLNLNCVPKTFSHSISCFAPCLAAPSILSSYSLSSTSPSFNGSGSRLLTSRINCADSRGLRGDGFTDPEPRTNTGYEPKLANFFNYMDPEHTPINIPDSHHNFLCPDDAVIPTSPEGLPNSGSSSSSKQTSDPPVSGNRVQVMCRVDQASRKLGQSWTENLLQQHFLVHGRKGKEIETQTLRIR